MAKTEKYSVKNHGRYVGLCNGSPASVKDKAKKIREKDGLLAAVAFLGAEKAKRDDKIKAAKAKIKAAKAKAKEKTAKAKAKIKAEKAKAKKAKAPKARGKAPKARGKAKAPKATPAPATGFLSDL